MVLRLLMRYLANNEQLIQRLSESYAIRRAAQLTLYAFQRSKMIAEEHRWTPERFRAFIRNFNSNFREELESAKRELKRK
ncbi:protein NCBP2AS2 homolog [Phlebotomus argentipes]|uniref:protein NCBP2AS2 homolog n=1 Tax=Phlebotomus argentipes TaxID=94469 RepID=UPI00289366AF|nr:protein NCBP2AS2 homolog [Phlebotomus argentipes]